jgi:uncharacterized protein
MWNHIYRASRGIINSAAIMVKGRGRGFASMSPEKRREVAGRGGKTAQKKGTAHKFTSAEASAAGKIGGKARPKEAQ